MLVLVLAALVVIGLPAGLIAIRPLVDDGAARVTAVLAGTVVVAIVLGGLLVVGGGSPSPTSSDPAADPDRAEDRRSNIPLRPATVRVVAPQERQLPAPPRSVGDLTDGDLAVVGVSGLEPGSQGSIHQCPTGATTPSRCQAGLRVWAGDLGSVAVLVDLQDELAVTGAAPVDCTGPTGCSLVYFGSSRVEVVTVFGRPAPPPATIDAVPDRVAPGGTTQATAKGLPPGARTSFAVCRPVGRGEVDCGTPTSGGVADARGEATAPVTVGSGRCPRGATCAVAVLVGDGGPQAFARLHLIGRSGATYDDARLRTGVLLAGLLLLGALWLLRRTDWTPVDGDPFADVELPADPFADDGIETASP